MQAVDIEILSHIDLKDFGEICVLPGDINGDGQAEFIIPQGVDGAERKASTGGYNHEKTIHCVTAIDMDGKVLWQNGAPMGAGHRKYHRAPSSGPCLVRDFDGDGQAEIAYVSADAGGGVWLRLLRGEDGRQVAEQETGACWALFPADLRGNGEQRDILVNDALTLHFAYSEDLTPIWEWKYFFGGGHELTARDVDGSGVDDLFVGACRLDAKGKRIWWRPDLDNAMEQHSRCPHVDHVKVERLHHDSDQFQVLWFGGKDVVCLDAGDGNVRWRVEGKHLQWHAVGRFDPGNPDQLVFVSEKPVEGPSYMLSADGACLWEKSLGRGMVFTVRGAGPEGSDLMLNSTPAAGENPYLMNHTGEKVAEFPLPGPVSGEEEQLYGRDTGHGFLGRPHDLDGDGMDEVLFYNRRELYVFKVG
jgi:hypothetical protein